MIINGNEYNGAFLMRYDTTTTGTTTTDKVAI